MSKPVPHGTTNAYTNLGCRCDKCRDAHRRKMAENQARRLARGLPDGDPRHGISTSYTNWGCRCDRCTAAHTAKRRGTGT